MGRTSGIARAGIRRGCNNKDNPGFKGSHTETQGGEHNVALPTYHSLGGAKSWAVFDDPNISQPSFVLIPNQEKRGTTMKYKITALLMAILCMGALTPTPSKGAGVVVEIGDRPYYN